MSLRAAHAGVAMLAIATLLLHPAAPKAQPTSSAPAAAPSNSPLPALPDTAAENAPDDSEALPLPPVPPRIAEGADYDRCMEMLATDPSGADALAATMALSAGAEAAQHCHALAQVELGNSETGATLLDKLAANSAAPASQRAEVFGQAGQAWTMAGKTSEAYASASQALALSPDDPDLRIGHAIAALALQRYGEAADDLSRALDQDPKRADALILRATAWRNLDKLDQARTDIDAAFAMDPDNPDALLERGIIRQRSGDLAGARQDWQQAADLAPDTPTGDLAQQDLALLEAGPRQ